ncbi:hypothetical protein DPMN_071129 [Dreissena polymorpha]|uniref:Uncharacterized protein n=1 Tax=Dreissena polymorpha TaxID=45954 RepID=A0A9D3Z6E5_DREPO|nr:hypothetical protein DPMN_071129 [Dreissena polymorpha]
MDHSYIQQADRLSKRSERTPTMFGLDHMYVKICDTESFTPAHTPPQSPKSLKRERSSPTGSSPHQPSKIEIAFKIIIAFSVQSKKRLKYQHICTSITILFL